MNVPGARTSGIDRERLHRDLRQLGICPGDLVMVHASLRRIGLARTDFGEGGAELLLDVLEEILGPAGTLLMTLGSHYEMDWVNLRPVEERGLLFSGSPPFDHRSAPAMKEVGWLAEVFRNRPGTLISANPSGRFGARGARAEDLLADQPWDDYYGPGSPLHKLHDWGGRILRLGAHTDTVTALHYAEYLADLPAKRRTRWDYWITGDDGPHHAWIECLDDSEGIANWPDEDYFTVILRDFLRLGRHREGRVGRIRSEFILASDLVGFGARWMERNLVPAGR